MKTLNIILASIPAVDVWFTSADDFAKVIVTTLMVLIIGFWLTLKTTKRK